MNKPNNSIKNWSEDDRPREKLLSNGRSALSNAELIAILIGSGNRNQSAVELSQEILRDSSNSLAKLSKLSVSELMIYKGIGKAKAISIVAALELGRRRKEEHKEKIQKIGSSKDAYQLVKHQFEDLHHEEFRCLMLSRSNNVLSNFLVSKGGFSATVVDGKVIYKEALAQSASGIILMHNHPSGNLQPSQADLNLTKKIKEFGALVDIQVLDHLIITDTGYLSLAEEGLII